jgi:Ankyrin repeats (3 copies)
MAGNGHGALANNNTAAALHLLQRGGELTLATAICLDKQSDIERLSTTATKTDLAIALVAAAFFGKADRVQQLLRLGANPNTWLEASSGFHWHATALHQAVYSGSLECVQLLVAAAADLAAKDRIYNGTPLGWAQHMLSEERDQVKKIKYTEIAAYLRSEEH